MFLMIQLFLIALAVITVTRTARTRGASGFLWGTIAAAGAVLSFVAAGTTIGVLGRFGATLVSVAGPFMWCGAVALYVRLTTGRGKEQPTGAWTCRECGWMNDAYSIYCDACKREFAAEGLRPKHSKQLL